MEKIPYAARIRPLLWVLTVVSIIEVAVVELVVPWAWLRWTLLVVGIAGLIWVARFGHALRQRPHERHGDRLRLRFATFTDVTVPLPAGHTMAGSIGPHENEADTFAVPVLGLTNVAVRFPEPIEINNRTVRVVRFYADDPAKALGASITSR